MKIDKHHGGGTGKTIGFHERGGQERAISFKRGDKAVTGIKKKKNVVPSGKPNKEKEAGVRGARDLRRLVQVGKVVRIPEVGFCRKPR